ncbi:MAG: N-acetylmuramoyl-L-alanine amidase [Deltaproteobacteria bacterium]|nr:N-acetylmuramoyl-L-alanine amidase [Deltaproteobacteria bacterium]MCW5805636.1 N-acetylmuramoyl-L-alanine amidase [Deltaproteobacteria bacterium]
MKQGDVDPPGQPGKVGPIRELQLALMAIGQASGVGNLLPRYGADGQFGDETAKAARQIFVKHGRRDEDDPDPRVIDEKERAFILALRDLLVVPDDLQPKNMVDRRPWAAVAAQQALISYGVRPWTSVWGVTLHQTACWLSNSSDPARCDAIGAHFVIYPSGLIYWLHDINIKIVHGNGLNARTYGIEIDGNFAGCEGDDSTRWKDGGRLGSVTDAQIESCKQLVRWNHARIVRNGGTSRTCMPHRVASGDRRNDPGSKVWQTCGIPLIAELGLDDGGPGFKFEDSFGGLPIPEKWDPSRRGIPY